MTFFTSLSTTLKRDNVFENICLSDYCFSVFSWLNHVKFWYEKPEEYSMGA